MTITGQSSLGKDDIARMVRDAETHAEDDRRRREEAELRNQSDTLVYQTEKMLKEYGEQVPSDEREKIEKSLSDVKDALRGSDMSQLRTAYEAALYASQSLAQRMYQQASQEGGDGQAPGAGASDEDVVDAEIVDG